MWQIRPNPDKYMAKIFYQKTLFYKMNLEDKNDNYNKDSLACNRKLSNNK